MAGIVEAYFDESEPDIGRRVFAVAGYLMWPDQARHMEIEWQAALQSAGIKYFHMADCAADPGNHEFKNLSKDERIALVKKLIGIIKLRTQRGICILTNPTAYESNNDGGTKIGKLNHYNGTVMTIMLYLSTALKQSTSDASISYYFESGYNLQSSANRVISSMLDRGGSTELRYAGHAFLQKADSPLLQAGDLLAWQAAKDLKNQLIGRKRRKDFQSLLEHRHTMMTAVPAANGNVLFTEYKTPTSDSQLRPEVVGDFFRSGGSRVDLPLKVYQELNWRDLPAD